MFVPANTVGCMQSAKETVAPVFTKVNSAAKQQYCKALENERVQYSQNATTAQKQLMDSHHVDILCTALT